MSAESKTLPTLPSVAAEGPPARVAVIGAFLATYLIWGSTYLAIWYAVATIPPLYTAGFRHAMSGSILLAAAWLKGQRATWRQLKASVVIGFFFFLVGHGTLHWAETRVSTGLASLLIATEPIWVFLLASAAERRWRMNGRLLAGVALGLGGVALLLGRDVWSAGQGVFLGAVACLVGAISWSAGIIYSRRSPLSGSPLLLSALSSLTGSAMLLAAGTLFGEYRGFHFHDVTVRSWLGLAYLIVFGSVIAFTAYNWLLEHYSPTLVATHTYVNPLVAVLLGWWLAGERVSVNVLIAAAMVVVAVFLVDRGLARLKASRLLLLAAIVVSPAAGARAGDVSVAPFVGFQYGGALQSAVSGRASIGIGLQYGATLDIPFGDRWGVDFLFARQESELRSEPRVGFAVERYMAGVREEKGEGRFRFRGNGFLGATRFAVDGLGSDVRFTAAIGLGTSMALTPHVALRADARAYYTVASFAGGSACVNGSCLYAFASSGVWQGDVTAGLELTF